MKKITLLNLRISFIFKAQDKGKLAMPKKVLINSRTSGKFKRELIDGRSHLVTIMMPIRGDITMNSKFYPDTEVANSFEQLNMLPAPHGHPMVNGINVPAFHPVANNKHNIGGFLRSPRKKGKRVFVDFMLDEEIANNSEAGKETIRRIESGEKIGVSTGLTINQVTNKAGEDDFGKPFNQEVAGFNFDHVAILLNEAAAGEHAGTELVLNEEGETIEVATIVANELSTSDIHEAISALIRTSFQEGSFVWIMDIFPESKTFVFSVEEKNSPTKLFKQSFAFDLHGEVEVLGDRIEVQRITEFVTKESFNTLDEVNDMDKNKVVLAIIGNSSNKFTVSDNARLLAMPDDELTALIATNTADEDSSKTLLTNAGYDLKAYDNFMANKEKFEAFIASEDSRLKVLRDDIVANSTYTPELVANKSEEELNVLQTLISPKKVAVRIPEGIQSTIHANASDTEVSAVDYT